MNLKTKLGFTLIELLVVITVIGILTAISTVSYSKVQAKGRDTQRINDLKKLQSALQLYYQDEGVFPTTGIANQWYSSETGDNFPNGPGNDGNWIPASPAPLAPKYIKQLPKDPKGGAGSTYSGDATCVDVKSSYVYRSDTGTGYALLSRCGSEAKTWDSYYEFYDYIRPNRAWKVCYGIGCDY